MGELVSDLFKIGVSTDGQSLHSCVRSSNLIECSKGFFLVGLRNIFLLKAAERTD